jgi:hypothetical protein
MRENIGRLDSKMAGSNELTAHRAAVRNHENYFVPAALGP